MAAHSNDRSRDGVSSWLATCHSWLDPVEMHQLEQLTTAPPPQRGRQHQQHRRVPHQNLAASPRSPYPFATCGRPRKREDSPPTRKRKRESSCSSRSGMDSNDSASNESGQTGKISAARSTWSSPEIMGRPILVPRPPSLKRSLSPTRPRNVLTQLHHASPPLRVCQPDSQLAMPPAAADLKRMLIRTTSSKIIPRGLLEKLRAQNPDELEAQLDRLEDPGAERSPLQLEMLWQAVDRIYEEASRCFNQHLDESAWVAVVRMVLDAAEIGSAKPHMLHVESIQTQAIQPDLHPQHVSLSFKQKADLAFSFSLRHSAVQSAIAPIQRHWPNLALSQMADPYTRTVPMVGGVEVKETGGDYNEAVLQLAVWCAAGLEAVQGLWQLARAEGGDAMDDMREQGGEGGGQYKETVPPFFGWTVIGHDWKLHIAWKSAAGDVVSISLVIFKY
ncbi:hypothetical protein JHW43_005151 [Diplocarpon mali]|nr:hypothetical protein JHW43_005151 [Diplocarpon mali]